MLDLERGQTEQAEEHQASGALQQRLQQAEGLLQLAQVSTLHLDAAQVSCCT